MSDKTPRPERWQWTLNEMHKSIELQSVNGTRRTILKPQRWGFNGATVYFNDGYILKPAVEFATIIPGHEHHAAFFKTIDHPDAALIAAAPDLLNACELTLHRLEAVHMADGLVADELRRSIAKARGEAA